MKCKNTECNNETNGKNVYCSLKCRNVYVNKYLRNYDKVKNTLKNKKEESKEEYLKNPKYCKQCNSIISFNKRNNNFCNSSCSAKYSNKLRKGIKLNITEHGKKELINSALKNLDKYKLERNVYYENPKKCLNCNKILEYKNRQMIFCDLLCKKDYYSKNLKDYTMYHSLSGFKFNLNKFANDFNFNLIGENGWYKAKNNGDNPNGITRDHKFSIREGFRRLINPLLLAHPANCELMTLVQNSSKWDKCSLNLDELLQQINKFDDKYGKYYNNELKIYIELNELREMYLKY